MAMTIDIGIVLSILFVSHIILYVRQIGYIGATGKNKSRRHAQFRACMMFSSYSLDILWCTLAFFSDQISNVFDFTCVIVLRWLVRRLILGMAQWFMGKPDRHLIQKTLKEFFLYTVTVFVAVNVAFVFLPASGTISVFIWVWLVWAVFDTVGVIAASTVRSFFSGQLRYVQGDGLCKKLTRLCHHIGCPPISLYIQDTPQSTDPANARLEGMGPFKRIIVNSSLLNCLEKDEVMSVIAHELGHQIHHHVLKYQILKTGLALCGVLLFAQFSTSLAVLVICAPALSTVALVFLNAYIRFCEYQADNFAAVYGGDGLVFLQALNKIHAQNATMQGADPVYNAIYSGHPTPKARVANLRKKR
jgi:Zn-dependent protease with chaperone function